MDGTAAKQNSDMKSVFYCLIEFLVIWADCLFFLFLLLSHLLNVNSIFITLTIHFLAHHLQAKLQIFVFFCHSAFQTLCCNPAPTPSPPTIVTTVTILVLHLHHQQHLDSKTVLPYHGRFYALPCSTFFGVYQQYSLFLRMCTSMNYVHLFQQSVIVQLLKKKRRRRFNSRLLTVKH